jgi:hypothetical protein
MEMKPMLREERSGLVRTSPPNPDGQESSANNSGHESEAGPTTEELVAELLKRGCAVTPALVGPNIASGLNPKGRPRSADAERKAREREQKLKKGMRQLNVMAPKSALAREFLMVAAEKIKSRKVLNALRAALEDPHLVTIGQKVLRLKGDVGDQVRRALDL